MQSCIPPPGLALLLLLLAALFRPARSQPGPDCSTFRCPPLAESAGLIRCSTNGTSPLATDVSAAADALETDPVYASVLGAQRTGRKCFQKNTNGTTSADGRAQGRTVFIVDESVGIDITGPKGVSLRCEDVVEVARKVARECQDDGGRAQGAWEADDEQGFTRVEVFTN